MQYIKADGPVIELAGVILTHNEARNVVDCVESLGWADHVVVFDSGSSDDTSQLARTAGAQVISHPFENYAQQRNAALERVEAEWIFFVDADERATPELAAEVRGVISNQTYRGWWVPRHNYIFGRLTKHAGWFPDFQMRVLHRASARYDPDRHVHEVVLLDGKAGHLTQPLIHYNYDTLSEFVAKQERYTDYEARFRFDAGDRPRARTFVTLPLRHFWWRFVSLRGYRDGLHGLLLSGLMAYYQFQTWHRVARLVRRGRSHSQRE